MTDPLRRMVVKVDLLSEDGQNVRAVIIERRLTDEPHVADPHSPPMAAPRSNSCLKLCARLWAHN